MTDKPLASALVWFRRDLRCDDHAALYHALVAARRVWCAFVFDRDILDPLLALGRRADRRVEYIHDSVAALDADLRALALKAGRPGSGLLVRHGRAQDELPRLAQALNVQAVYANHDDDPAALARDAHVRGALAEVGIALHTSKDHVIFERSEVLGTSGKPYGVFTPYRTAWLKKLTPFYLSAYPVERHAAALAAPPAERTLPTLESLGFERSNLHALGMPGGSARARELADDFAARIEHYDAARDFPALKGPSYLSLPLRFGTLSIRAAGAGGARARAARLARRRDLAVRTRLARLLPPDPAPPSARRAVGLQARIRRAALGARPPRRGALRRLVRGPHRLSAGRCRDGADQPDRLHAQPPAHGDGELPRQGPGARLAPRRSLLRAAPERLRPRRQQRRLAVGRVDRLRRATLVSHLQSGHAERASSTRDGRFIRRYLPQLAALPDAALHAPWLARPADLAAAGVELGRQLPAPIVQHDEARARTLAALRRVAAGALMRRQRRWPPPSAAADAV